MTETKGQERLPSDLPLVMDTLITGRDRFVTNVRWSCVTEQAEAALREGLQTELELGLTPGNVTAPEICEEAAAQAVRRGIVDDLYRRFRRNDPRGAYEQILRQALQNSGDTGIQIPGTDDNYGLTCALAFEAGYRFGTENPDRDPAPDMTKDQLENGVRDCLVTDSRVSRRDGLVLGAKSARRRQGEDISAIDPIPGDVPDVRDVASASRSAAYPGP